MNKQSQKKIGWCDATVNAVRGCTFNCPFDCYARRFNSRRLPGSIPDFSKPQFFPERLKQLKSKKPRIIFMDSMSDIADWRIEWMEEVFNAIIQNQQHRYIFLTKCPEIYQHTMFDWLNDAVGDIVWIGTSICRHKDEHRASKLYQCHNFLSGQFASIEPLLGPIDPECLQGLKWVVLGSETGSRKGKVIALKDWINDIAFWCGILEIPLFMKDRCVPIVGEENMLRQFPEGLAKGGD